MNLKFKEITLQEILLIFILIGLLAGLLAPALELYNLSIRSNKLIIALEFLLFAFLLMQAYLLDNGKAWKKAIILGLPVLGVDILERIFDINQVFKGFGYFNHFWIGIAMTAALILVYDKDFKFIFIFNSATAILWEIGEYMDDKIFAAITPVWLTDPFWDTLLDIALTICGMLVAYYVLRRKKVNS